MVMKLDDILTTSDEEFAESILIKDMMFNRYMDIYLQKSRTHDQDVYELIKQDICKKYYLNDAMFNRLYIRMSQKYIETDTYRKKT